MNACGVTRPKLPGVLVAAFGNPDRGDDGAGPLVAQALAGRLPPDVALLPGGTDPLVLMHSMAGYDVVICVDSAATTGETPGRIHRIEPGEGSLRLEQLRASTHGVGLAEVIELAAALGTSPGRLVVYAIEGNDFALGARPGHAVSRAAATAAERIVGEVARLRSAVDPREVAAEAGAAHPGRPG